MPCASILKLRVALLSASIGAFAGACRGTGDSVLADDSSMTDKGTMIRVAHYNIKELTTERLLDSNNVQVNTAASILRAVESDVLSINEIQYDRPDVPRAGLPGTGENMRRLLSRVERNPASKDLKQWNSLLAEANTGRNARRQPDGNYSDQPSSPTGRQLADPTNFGVFPGQCSTGFATRFDVVQSTVIRDLTWNNWDAQFDPAAFTSGGQPVPSTVELFDKSFTDVVVQAESKRFHVILLHTVPAFGFGDPTSINLVRNAAQLEFLEWYVTGSCDASSAHSAVRRCETSIRPLSSDEPFVVVGDLNVDVADTSKPGATVLERLLANRAVAIHAAPTHGVSGFQGNATYISPPFSSPGMQARLDYIIPSRHFEVVSSRIVFPDGAVESHGCFDDRRSAEEARDTVARHLPRERVADIHDRRGANGQRSFCVESYSRELGQIVAASDHLPVVVELKLR